MKLLQAIMRSVAYHLLALTSLVFPSRPPLKRSVAQSEPLPDWEIVELPLVIPPNQFDSAALEKMNVAVYRHALRRLVVSKVNSSVRSVAIVDHPLLACALEKGGFDRIYYDCIDHLSLYAGHASLQHALALERAEVIEGRPRGEAEALADLANGGRHAVPLAEDTDELQHLSFPSRQLSHLVPSLAG